jgi:predicted Zn-dependent protease
MPYRISRFFLGRALPALFIPLFLLPILFSCSKDNGTQANSAAQVRPVASEPAAVDALEPLSKVQVQDAGGPALEVYEVANNGDLEGAERLLRQAIAADGPSPALNSVLARVLAEKGKKEMAAGALASAIASFERFSPFARACDHDHARGRAVQVRDLRARQPERVSGGLALQSASRYIRSSAESLEAGNR